MAGSPTSPTLAAIILAGGQSTRMGQDKALIAIAGVPMLRRVCEVALQCTPLVYVVTPWIERYQSILPPTCQMVQEYRPPGAIAPQGPLVGFAQGLTQVSTEWVLLLACDLPQLNVDELNQWKTNLGNAGQAIALLPRNPKGWDALCGFYRTDCLPRVMAAIERGDRSFQRWLVQEVVQALPVGDRVMLFNCNTPADLETIRIGRQD